MQHEHKNNQENVQLINFFLRIKLHSAFSREFYPTIQRPTLAASEDSPLLIVTLLPPPTWWGISPALLGAASLYIVREAASSGADSLSKIQWRRASELLSGLTY